MAAVAKRKNEDTARKHGRNAMDVLHQLMVGRPERPPAAALPHSQQRETALPITMREWLNVYFSPASQQPRRFAE
jgi:hypothetical protein